MAYSEEFKRQVVAEYEAGGISQEALRLRHRIGGSMTVLKWISRYGKGRYPVVASVQEHGPSVPEALEHALFQARAELEQAREKIAAYEAIFLEAGVLGLDVAKKRSVRARPGPEHNGERRG